jgi:hypothetical protein
MLREKDGVDPPGGALARSRLRTRDESTTMNPIGAAPIGGLGFGCAGRSDDLPWQLTPASEDEIAHRQELFSPLQVVAPRTTLVFNARDPIAALDRLLTLYSDPRTLDEYLRGQHGVALSGAQLSDATACLRQGHEFLRVSSAGGLTTRPLTAYYSFLALSMALILTTPGTDRGLAGLRGGHGLTVEPDFGTPLADLRVRSKGKGLLFQRLYATLGSRVGLPVRTAKGHVWVRTPLAEAEPPRQPVTLKDLLARITGIEDVFTLTFGNRAGNVKAQIWCSDPFWCPPRLALVVDGFSAASFNELCELITPVSEWRLVEEWSRSHRVDLLNVSSDFRGDLVDFDELRGNLRAPSEVMMPLSRGPLGDWRLVSPTGGVFWPQPLLTFMASFLLSTVARYRPDIWSGVITRGEAEGSAGLRALIDDFYGVALIRFPLDILASILRVDLAVYDRAPVIVSS